MFTIKQLVWIVFLATISSGPLSQALFAEKMQIENQLKFFDKFVEK